MNMTVKRIGLVVAAAVTLSAIELSVVAINNSSHHGSTSDTSSIYRSMMGGRTAPAWMTGGSLPTMMMGAARDRGRAMGAALAEAPGPRVRAGDAARMGTQVLAGTVADTATRTLTVRGTSVALTIVASPSGGPTRPSASRAWSTRPWSSHRAPECKCSS